MPNPNSLSLIVSEISALIRTDLIVSEISAFTRTDGHGEIDCASEQGRTL